MPKTLIQTVKFKVPPEVLYEIYMDAKKHSAAIQAPVTITRKVNDRFYIFGKSIFGKNLVVIPSQLIVQTWRADDWKVSDADSILNLSFKKDRGGAVVELIHVYIPDNQYAGIKTGWTTYYWNPWKEYLKTLA